MEEYYTVKEVADEFRVKERTIRLEIGEGRLQANYVRGAYRISAKDLKAYKRLTGARRKISA